MDHWPTGKLCEADLWVNLTYHTAQLYAGLKENIDFPNFWQYRKCLLADCLTFWRGIGGKCASIFPGFCHEGGPDRCWKNAATSVLAKKLSCRAVTSATSAPFSTSISPGRTRSRWRRLQNSKGEKHERGQIRY